MKVTVVGAGAVGATCADNIARKQICDELVIVDIKEGFAEGKAMDLSQTAQIEGFDTKITGSTNDYSKTAGSTSKVVRLPGTHGPICHTTGRPTLPYQRFWPILTGLVLSYSPIGIARLAITSTEKPGLYLSMSGIFIMAFGPTTLMPNCTIGSPNPRAVVLLFNTLVETSLDILPIGMMIEIMAERLNTGNIRA